MRRTLVSLGSVAFACASALAEESRRARGTHGLDAVPFSARNAGPQPVACVAALAHWYSIDLGRADPGRSLETTLWYDAKGGELFVLNDVGDRMPVQALTCGPVGAAWTTGTPIGFERRSGSVPAPVRLTCRMGNGKLTCD